MYRLTRTIATVAMLALATGFVRWIPELVPSFRM